MNILEILIHLRDDLKSWASFNFEKLNKKIDKKSQARFSRDYHDLYNAPQITDDNKKELSIADEAGNIIFKLDEKGAHTIGMTLDGKDAATEEYVNEAIENIVFPETDLSNYPTKEELEEAIDNIDFPVTDLTGYATEEFVGKAIENIDFPETDLTDYATKKNVEDAIAAIDFPETDLTGYATEQYVDKKVADLVDSAPEALNTLGELAEAMGEHEDAYDALLETVGQKATREEVKDLEKALNNGAESEAEEYCIADKNGNMIFKADKEGVETTAVKTKALTVGEKDLATHIQDAIDAIEFPETDLSNYPTKGEVEQAIADIEFPVIDLTGYATEEFVGKAIEAIDFPEPDLSEYATEEFVKNKIAEAKLEGEDIDLSGYATKSDLNGFIKEIPAEYVNEQELGEVIEQTKKDLGENTSSGAEEFQIADEEGNVIVRVNKDGVHTTNLTFGGGVAATQEFVNEAIENIQFPETDLSNYPTKEEMQQAIADIDFPETDLTDYATKKFVGEEIAKIEFPETDLTGYATEKFVADEIGKIEFPETDLTGYATEDYVDKAIEEIEFPVTDLSGYATEEFVGKAIEAIDFPETDLSDYATKQNVANAVLAHKQDTNIHVTQEERDSWFDGKYGSLEGAPSIDEADDKTYSIADSEGNVIFKVDENGTHTTNLTINGEVATTKQYVDGAIKQAVDNIDIPEVDLSNHATKQYVDEAIDNIEFPVTDLTGYATEQFVKDEVAGLVNSAPEALDTLGELATAMKEKGDAIEALELIAGSKAAQTDLNETNQQLGAVKELVGTTSVEDQIEEALDNFETFSGDYNDLINAPDIAEDSSGDMAVADKDGNVAFKVDSEGRTHVTSLAIGGENLESILEKKATKEEITLTALGLTYGKSDLTPGVSPLPTGHFYFVYE